ncbi:MAG: hypothetical protein NTY03_05105, partial [Candidatus Bathyarchaeota archaeon]|nr:hypothetical protein [Candidatus Bathyarchaeota archaeon]
MNKFVAIGKCFRTHKKHILMHSLILCGFVFYAVFLAGPLFDGLLAIEGESSLHKTSLPDETNNIVYSIGTISPSTHIIEFDGWAFVEGQSTEDIDTYVIFKSNEKTYIFDTNPRKRFDVTAHFDVLDLNLDDAGFMAWVPVRKIKKGEYSVGIYIRKGDTEALQYTNMAIVKSASGVEVIDVSLRISQIQHIALPPPSENIRYNLEVLRETTRGGEVIVEIAGWAFIEGRSSEDSQIFAVLRSDRRTYVFDTVLKIRPDVTAYFETLNINLDDSGFRAT